MKLQDLIGKTISIVEKLSPDGYDEEPYLRLDFTDGTHCFVVADYGNFSDTISSRGEYPRYIDIVDSIEDREE